MRLHASSTRANLGTPTDTALRTLQPTALSETKPELCERALQAIDDEAPFADTSYCLTWRTRRRLAWSPRPHSSSVRGKDRFVKPARPAAAAPLLVPVLRPSRSGDQLEAHTSPWTSRVSIHHAGLNGNHVRAADTLLKQAAGRSSNHLLPIATPELLFLLFFFFLSVNLWLGGLGFAAWLLITASMRSPAQLPLFDRFFWSPRLSPLCLLVLSR
ncbi:hypothetical protein SODALDRAFT_187813 [Sodiomyces alkalinus F11]|uniref:Uncharacterized protein n=1 Tax=Sodiomyces alkalinus (strain CBS 110278 / VKM F-3762 / F11) TaxID=1314773 RepID=A0A3N2PRE7_SODAK|nr:hypothetical protein SODALDRAFT_187813 [Sodiomyces alkalinus F11]ROT37083.1 hypothetical protein SODALDRAFT_187813 [Sodiomyces alkalinus F11]